MKIKDNLKNNNLLKNTIMLYILQFSTYFFAFITVPYQTRIMGISVYGKIGFATSIMVYFQLLIDFGFILSATEEIARHRENKELCSKVFTCVTVSKIILMVISLIFLRILFIFTPMIREDFHLYILFWLATCLNSLIPDYLYRGLEQMRAITIRTVGIKMFFTIMIFIFLRKPSDYYIIPILNIIGSIVAIIGVYIHLTKKLKIKFINIEFREIINTLKTSSGFFYSRIASTAYGASNSIILGFVDPTGTFNGIYSSAEKLVSTARSGMTPIADSIYPYMIKNKDFKLIKKILKLVMPIILCGCLVVFIFAESICVFLFGSEFINAANVLKCLIPIILITLPSYMLGFPTLGAMGLNKEANNSILIGSIIHIINITFLLITNNINLITLAMSTTMAELVILIYRVMIIYYHRRKIKNN